MLNAPPIKYYISISLCLKFAGKWILSNEIIYFKFLMDNYVRKSQWVSAYVRLG